MEPGLDLGGHLVHGVGADQNKVGPRPFQTEGGVGKELGAPLPITPGLAFLDGLEIHAV